MFRLHLVSKATPPGDVREGRATTNGRCWSPRGTGPFFACAEPAVPLVRTARQSWSTCRLQSEYEQHRLAAHVAKLRGVDECGPAVPAKPRQDGNILLPADLEGHRGSIDA